MIGHIGKIQTGDVVGSLVLVLDTEFFSRARKLYEVALAELTPGQVLLNARVDHECTREELTAPPDRNILTRLFEVKKIQSVYGSRDPRKCNRKKIAKEVARMIVKIGVTPKSTIIVWQQSTMDLEPVQEFLVSPGYHDLMPRSVYDSFSKGGFRNAPVCSEYCTRFSTRFQLGRNNIREIDTAKLGETDNKNIEGC